MELLKQEKKMTSLEIAELTGKQHFHVMRDIREMEPAWEKVSKSKFGLTSRKVEQPNGGEREVPCYELTKTECLYIATKFNDEARAKLVLRWEQLEKERIDNRPSYEIDDPIERAQVWIEEHKQLLLAQKQAEQNQEKADYYDEVLHPDTLFTTKMIAMDYGMTASDFNKMLSGFKVQYKQGNHWYLYKDYLNKGYAGTETYLVDTPKEVVMTMKWTQKGRAFPHDFLAERGIKTQNKLF